MLTAAALHDAFMELGLLARGEGKVIDLAVYGGSALMLASNFRVSTRDIDAVAASDQGLVDRLAGAIAARRGWAADWLNDGVRMYLSPNVDGVRNHHALFRGYLTGYHRPARRGRTGNARRSNRICSRLLPRSHD
ncbi:MAG: hypothetical protein H0T75_21105 [Rhizobiales bacterium]|nr:hypothetical protein [Hyphomicrobiales bacterium]